MDEENNAGGRRNWRDFYRPGSRPAWLTGPVMAIAGVIIIVGLVFLGRFIHHSLRHEAPATNTGNSGQVVPPIAKQPSASPSTSGSTGSSSNSANKPASSGQAASQLPNSGPGDVAAIFLTTSLVAAGAHYVVHSRKNSLS